MRYHYLFVLLIWFGVLVIVLPTIAKPQVFRGQDLKRHVAVGDTVKFSSEVSIEAGEGYPFVFLKKDDGTIFGQKEKPPVGWTHQEYYILPETRVEGEFLVVEGDVTIHVWAEGPVTVTVIKDWNNTRIIQILAFILVTFFAGLVAYGLSRIK